MRSLRYITRLILTFVSRFRIILLLGIGVGAAIFIFLSLFAPYFLGKKVERVGITGRYHTDNLPSLVLQDISQGLTEVDEQGNVFPALADKWKVLDEGKTWVFHLAPDNYWQDGKKLKAEHIKYQFEEVEIEYPDEETVVFRLKTPFSPFSTTVAKPVFRKGLLGTGKWRVIRLSLAGSYVDQIVLQDKEKNRKIIKFYPTEERTKLAFKLGEIDKIEDLINPQPFNEWGVVDLSEKVSKSRYVAVFFNTQDEFLADKSLRQALSYAIDKKNFAGERALSPICPDCWAYNPQVKTYDYDPERAKDLLSDLPSEVIDNLEINLVTTPILLDLAEQIANYWREIGIQTNVQVTSIFPEEYQAFLVIHDIPADPDQYATWHSTQGATNIAKYRNPRIDKLLEDGRTEIDQEERKKIYLDFQRFLLEDAPAVFLYHPISYTVQRK